MKSFSQNMNIFTVNIFLSMIHKFDMIINNMINRRIIYINNVINFFACMLFPTNFEFDYMYKQKINVQITLQTISIVNMRIKKKSKKCVPGIYLQFCMF